ncbi:hypothetical protein D3C72_1275670 [compost metagenome]
MISPMEEGGFSGAGCCISPSGGTPPAPSPKSGEGESPEWAAVMKSFHAFAGSPPPVTFFIDVPSSLPNHTPVVRLLV